VTIAALDDDGMSDDGERLFELVYRLREDDDDLDDLSGGFDDDLDDLWRDDDDAVLQPFDDEMDRASPSPRPSPDTDDSDTSAPSGTTSDDT
jgi:hypothetical protein